MLGANDGIISTASLIVGVAAAAAKQSDVLIAGVAGLVAGAMSMAAGEYVSVSSQSDTEKADRARERGELSEEPPAERDEFAEIYVKRGVDRTTARQVALQLMARDPLTAHARDELGISEITTARPVQAALTSAVMFSVGAAMPLLMVAVSLTNVLVPIVSGASLGFLALLGAIGAKAGGANILRAPPACNFLGRIGPRYHRRNREAVRNDRSRVLVGSWRMRRYDQYNADQGDFNKWHRVLPIGPEA